MKQEKILSTWNKLMMKRSIFMLLLLVDLLFSPSKSLGSKPIEINKERNYLFLSGKFIDLYEDKTGKREINTISSRLFADSFQVNEIDFPVTKNSSSSYWIRFTLQKLFKDDDRNWVIELYDSKADYFEIYIPDGKGRFIIKKGGDIFPFSYKNYDHKNFVFDIPSPLESPELFYIKFKSSHPTGTIGVIKSYKMFAGYAAKEYYLIALFYGIILAMSVFNLLMFIITKDRPYLFYVLYIISLGFYGLSIDGTGFQYVWPNYPELNNYISEVALVSLICWLLLYAQSFLEIKRIAPLWNKILSWIIIARLLIFAAGMSLFPSLRYNAFIEFIPLLAAFTSGIVCLRKNYTPARYYVIAFALLFIGYIISRMQELEIIKTNLYNIYSFNIGGALEMLLLSLALADRVKNLTKEKEKAQQEIIIQLKENEELKDQINKNLEAKVAERTQELKIKNEELNTQNETLEEKSEELREAYEYLQEQAAEIKRINELLHADNKELQSNVKELVKARVLHQEVNYEEFRKIFPDDETCLKYLYDLKEKRGYVCKKCNNHNFFKGKDAFSRRCTKCGYNESVTASTIFHKLKFPLVKAFYLVFLVYANKEKINSTELSQILTLRQSTCWAFSKKVLEKIKEKKKSSMDEDGWITIIFDNQE